MKINNREIGQGHPCYVIAEMSANHGGSFEKAKAIVHAAKKAGADAIKLQTYKPETMTLRFDNEYFRIPGGLWKGKTLYDLYAEAMTPWEWHTPLKAEAEKLGLDFFSTPFDETALDFLEQLNVPVHKIASFELTDAPLLKKVGSAKKPVILSTGMASTEEIAMAVSLLKSAGAKDVALLKCISAYPAPLSGMNLRGIATLREMFACEVGLSDHSVGPIVPLAAVGLGMSILEKHLCLDDGAETPDSAFSLRPSDFKAMVDQVRQAESALGSPHLGRTADEKDNLRFRRSIFVSRDIAAGEKISTDNIRVVRPGFGLSPSQLMRVMGSAAVRGLKAGQPLLTGDVLERPQPVNLVYRKVTEADAKLLFDWKNETATRASACIQKEISWDEHVAWLAKRLQDSNTLFFIAMSQDRPVGQARFDIDKTVAKISIGLDKDFRGQGLGERMLRELCARVFAETPVTTFEAEIRRENTASLASFFKAGFTFTGAAVVHGAECFVCSLKR